MLNRSPSGWLLEPIRHHVVQFLHLVRLRGAVWLWWRRSLIIKRLAGSSDLVCGRELRLLLHDSHPFCHLGKADKHKRIG